MLTPELFLPTVSGDGGTYATLGKMKSMARGGSGASNPLVRAIAASLVIGVPPSGVAQAKIIRNWLEDHTIFLRDLSTAEALYSPVVLATEIQKKGIVQCDCEDVAMLAAALGMSIGLRARFVVLAFRPHGPFQHVYTELADPARRVWIECDITRPSQIFHGVNPTRTYKTEV